MALAPQFDQLIIDNGSDRFKEASFVVPSVYTEKEYGSYLLSIELPDSPDGSKKFSRLLQKAVADNLYKDLSADPHESLERTLQVVNEEVAKNIANFGDWAWQASVVLAVFSQNELHISTSGQAALYLIRSGQIVNVAEGLAEGNVKKEQKLFFSIASGQLEEGDVCVATTSDLSRFIKPKKLASTVKNALSTLSLGSRASKGVVSAIMKELDLPEKQLLNLAVVHLSVLAQLSEQAAATTKGLLTLFHKWQAWWQKAGQGIAKLPPDKVAATDDAPLAGKAALTPSWSHRFKKTWQMVQSRRGLRETARSLGMSLPQQKRQRHALAITAVICLLILLGAIGVIKKNQRANDQRLTVVFKEMMSDRQAAETRRLFDKEGARRLLNNSHKLGRQLEEAGYKPLEVSSELVKVNLLLDDISDVSRINTAKVYNDVKKVAKASARGLLYQGGDVYVYENTNLYKVLLDKIESYPLLKTDEEIIAATAFQYRDSFLFLTNQGKLYEFKGSSVKEVPHPSEGSWPQATAIVEYSESRNVYFLDPANNEVWAYRATTTGFSGPSRKNVVKSDLSESRSLAVDGNLYILRTGGKVIKTYGGSPREFNLAGLPDGLGEPTKLVTGLAQDYVYLLFPQKHSIIRTDKRGNYLRQYLIDDPGFAAPVDFKTNESLGKLFVVDSGGKVIEVTI